MSESWYYDKEKRCDLKGRRWHFLFHHVFSNELKYEDCPYELYFRNDDRTEFGLLRFEKRKDNPYRDYNMVINKIMNNREFRKTLLNPDTAEVWNKNWK